MTKPQPSRAIPDQGGRDRIQADRASTLFVEAGAGSGKTTALVGRIIALVSAGDVELREIAAITFTEKAAAELRDRLREGLEREVESARGVDPARAKRCELAIDQLDASAVGTLHAFAQRILSEHPVPAGLPPRVEVLDEVAGEVVFEQRWRSFRDELFSDPTYERTLLLLVATGLRLDPALRALAVEFDRNWDLVKDRVPDAMPPPPSARAAFGPALDVLDAVCGRIADCIDGTDRMAQRLGQLADWSATLRACEDDVDLIEAARGSGSAKPSFRVGNVGRKDSWRIPIATVRAEVGEAEVALDEAMNDVTVACARQVAAALRGFTLSAAEERRRRGELAFHDLLVHARSLLGSPEQGAEVRSRLHQRYRRLLLDEFQDTDPIQVELAVRIAAATPAGAEAGTLPWEQVPVAAGHLFVVGDPKQSIYRFRRADIAVFLAAAERFGSDGGRIALTTNFRTGAPVVDWVNHTFEALLAEGADAEVPTPSQAPFEALSAVRPAAPVGPAVSVMGRAPMPKEPGVRSYAARLRTAEAADVAAAVLRISAEGWSVGTGDEADPWRPARLGDITILVPTRTSLPFLEDALEASGIAYRAEASSLVYASRAIRDLLMVLRAIDDPTDHLAVVSALRSSLFGCGDDELFRFKVLEHGHWNHQAPPPDGATAGPVTEGLAYLRDRHRERFWTSPAELLDRVAVDRRAFELGFGEGRPRDVWRRLRFVIDQARAWSDATSGGLRDYLQWVARQSGEGSRVAEAVLPETDDDAVRIMTIHAAKGLEFPVTILSGMSTKPQARPSPAQVVFPPGTNQVGYRFGRFVTTQEFEAFKPIDEQMALDERIRLLYVATTRARDHLVVSLHREERSAQGGGRTNAELLVEGMGEQLDQLPDAADLALPPHSSPEVLAPTAPVPIEQWRSDRARALDAGGRPTTVAATALRANGEPEPELAPAAEPDPAAAGLRKQPPDQDLPPWIKGRYGTAVGRAVHGVLQTVDLASGAGLEGAVAAQAQAEAVGDRAEAVTALVRAALASPTVQAAATAEHWREVYACIPTPSGRLLEGYLDLLYRGPAGLVVVDYKTAATDDRDELARRTAGYRLQGASYALTIGEATGEVVARVCFVYLTPSGAVEVDIDDLDAALAEVRALIARGQEVRPSPV